jgi:hypothetical protein
MAADGYNGGRLPDIYDGRPLLAGDEGISW